MEAFKLIDAGDIIGLRNWAKSNKILALFDVPNKDHRLLLSDKVVLSFDKSSVLHYAITTANVDFAGFVIQLALDASQELNRCQAQVSVLGYAGATAAGSAPPGDLYKSTKLTPQALVELLIALAGEKDNIVAFRRLFNKLTFLQPRKLTLKVVQAAGLVAADPYEAEILFRTNSDADFTSRNGLSDPYAVVYYGANKVKTKVKSKTLDPQWQQSFEFDLAYACPLYVEIFDKDLVGSDDFLGCAWIDTETASRAPSWYTLVTRKTSPKDKDASMKRLSLQPTPTGSPLSSSPYGSPAIDSPLSSFHGSPVLGGTPVVGSPASGSPINPPPTFAFPTTSEPRAMAHVDPSPPSSVSGSPVPDAFNPRVHSMSISRMTGPGSPQRRHSLVAYQKPDPEQTPTPSPEPSVPTPTTEPTSPPSPESPKARPVNPLLPAPNTGSPIIPRSPSGSFSRAPSRSLPPVPPQTPPLDHQPTWPTPPGVVPPVPNAESTTPTADALLERQVTRPVPPGLVPPAVPSPTPPQLTLLDSPPSVPLERQNTRPVPPRVTLPPAPTPTEPAPLSPPTKPPTPEATSRPLPPGVTAPQIPVFPLRHVDPTVSTNPRPAPTKNPQPGPKKIKLRPVPSAFLTRPLSQSLLDRRIRDAEIRTSTESIIDETNVESATTTVVIPTLPLPATPAPAKQAQKIVSNKSVRKLKAKLSSDQFHRAESPRATTPRSVPETPQVFEVGVAVPGAQEPDEPLECWYSDVSDEGFVYYYNVKSGRSTWDLPVGFETIAEEFDTSAFPESDPTPPATPTSGVETLIVVAAPVPIPAAAPITIAPTIVSTPQPSPVGSPALSGASRPVLAPQAPPIAVTPPATSPEANTAVPAHILVIFSRLGEQRARENDLIGQIVRFYAPSKGRSRPGSVSFKAHQPANARCKLGHHKHTEAALCAPCAKQLGNNLCIICSSTFHDGVQAYSCGVCAVNYPSACCNCADRLNSAEGVTKVFLCNSCSRGYGFTHCVQYKR